MCSLNNCALALRVVYSLIRSAGRVPSLSRMWKKCRFIVTGSCAGLCKKPHREMSEVAAESKASNVATLAATSAFMYDGGADVLPEPGRRAGRLPPLGSSAAQSLVVIWLLDRGVPVAKECESDDFSLSRKQVRTPETAHA